MYATLKRAAGRVLLSRNFGTSDGTTRWLRADFHHFDMLMREELLRLRPIAKLHKLTKLGNRIMVELGDGGELKAFLKAGTHMTGPAPISLRETECGTIPNAIAHFRRVISIVICAGSHPTPTVASEKT
ncbi:hypothetical protein [Profundibacter sp.]|uniref:hypothetical protein n=1 Tax=Profundibacter sp. TaxID=3101071 RepID=UPI003D114C0C